MTSTTAREVEVSVDSVRMDVTRHVALQARWYSGTLPFREPLQTSRGEWKERSFSLLELRDDKGLSGWGESAPLQGVASRKNADTHAIEQALLDWMARYSGHSLARMLAAGPAQSSILLNGLLAGKTPESCALLAQEAIRQGFRVLKLKVSSEDLANDLARVRAVREAVGPAVGLRLDANGGWTLEEAIQACQELVRWSPEYVEQPLSEPSFDELQELRKATRIPLGWDETLHGPDALLQLLKARAVDVAVLKPPRVGGLLNAFGLGLLARLAGVSVVVTSSLDSWVGRMGALHLAAALESTVHPQDVCRLLCDGLPKLESLVDEFEKQALLEGEALQLQAKPRFHWQAWMKEFQTQARQPRIVQDKAHGLATGCLFLEDVHEDFLVSGGCGLVPVEPGLGGKPTEHALALLQSGSLS